MKQKPLTQPRLPLSVVPLRLTDPDDPIRRDALAHDRLLTAQLERLGIEVQHRQADLTKATTALADFVAQITRDSIHE